MARRKRNIELHKESEERNINIQNFLIDNRLREEDLTILEEKKSILLK